MFGDKIRHFRKSAGLSQFELELAINASPGSISRIENNLVNPSKETLYKISTALELDKFNTMELLGIKFSNSEKHIPQRLLNQEIVNGLTLSSIISGDYNEYALLVGKDNFIKECDSTLDNPEDEILYLENMETWRKVYSEEDANEQHVPRRIKAKMYAKFLLNKGSQSLNFKAGDYKMFRESRIINNNKEFEFSLMITSKQITVFHIDPTATAFTLHNSTIANKAKATFNTLWSKALQ